MSSQASQNDNKKHSDDSQISDISVSLNSRRGSQQKSKLSKKSRQSRPFSNERVFQGPVKLKDLKISNSQLLQFTSRVGRRLLKNQQFLDKLADCLDNFSVSDTSERDEEKWGLGDGSADLAGYEDLYSDGQLESSSSDNTNIVSSRNRSGKSKSFRSSSFS